MATGKAREQLTLNPDTEAQELRLIYSEGYAVQNNCMIFYQTEFLLYPEAETSMMSIVDCTLLRSARHKYIHIRGHNCAAFPGCRAPRLGMATSVH